MKLALKILLPLLVLAAGAFLGMLLLQNRPEAQPRAGTRVEPHIRALTVHPETVRIDVASQGTVVPRTEIDLVPQVSGKVVAISPALRSGGFFAAGDVLVQVEPRDFELMVLQRRAAVAQAELRLQQEQAEAEAALDAWRSQHGEEPADPLLLREPQVAEAKASLAAAGAALEQADLNLTRTRITAPFPGRVRSARVDVGQYVVMGAPVARIYAVDFAEVRLPIPDSEVQYLDLPLHFVDQQRPVAGPNVLLTASFAGRSHRWNGIVERTEGEIDRSTRQVYVVARVAAPYAASEDPDRPPLAAGMFVTASIEGRTFHGVFQLPRNAVQAGDVVMIVDPENRLYFRDVDVLRRTRDTVLIHGGLKTGDRVCLTSLEAATEGMLVRVAEEPMPGAPPGESKGSLQTTSGR